MGTEHERDFGALGVPEASAWGNPYEENESSPSEELEAIRRYISELVYGLIAQIAYSASTGGMDEVRLVETPGRLIPALGEPIVHALGLDLYEAPSILSMLGQELYDAALSGGMRQRWGQLRAQEGGRLVIELAPPDEPRASGDRSSRARVVDGVAAVLDVRGNANWEV